MDSIQPEQTKLNTSLLKLFLAVIFFPFTISYLILKQKQFPLIGRVVGVAVLWIVFIAIGASGSKSSDNTTTQNTVVEQTVTPTPAITMEQKQADFTNLFLKYNSLSEQVLTIQKKILDASNLTSNREDLYMALDSLSKQQANLSQVSFDLEIPDSLKEYKDLSTSIVNLALTSAKFKNSIEEFKKYVNTTNLESLKKAKEQVEFGKENLNTSIESMKKVAVMLSVDISDPKKMSIQTGTKESAVGMKIPFELVEEQSMAGAASGNYNRSIVIKSINVNEADLKILGEEINEYVKKDKFSFIQVFSDNRAATEIRGRYTNEDKTLSKTDSDLYERSFIGQYIKSGNVHNFTFCLTGYYLDDCKGEENKRVIEYK